MKNILATNLAVYGSAHAAVDASCAAVLFSLLKIQAIGTGEFFSFVILYNVLAFGFQPFFGMASDRFHASRLSAMSGCILTAISAAVVIFSPLAAVILAGLGNAMFHVGGGSISLNLTPKKASAPGVFVAPGAIGLLIGTLIGTAGLFSAWYFIIILFAFCIVMINLQPPAISYKTESGRKLSYLELIVILVLMSIAIRSLVGMAIAFPWKSDIYLLIALTCAVVLGKGMGGILADRFGWRLIGVSSLVISAPLISFGVGVPYVAIAGMFLFNMTMPVTLAAISNTFPGRPGFSFGLTCLALIAGALPAFTEIRTAFVSQLLVMGVVLVSALSLAIGLTLLLRDSKSTSRHLRRSR